MENIFLTYKFEKPEYTETTVNNDQKDVFSDFMDIPYFDYQKQRMVSDQTDIKEIEEAEVDVDNKEKDIIEKEQLANPYTSQYKGNKYDTFKKYFDQIVQEDSSAEKYRRLLIDIASAESGFDSRIQNKAGAPAYGYFQFMQDGKKWNNISKYAGTDTETFRNDPLAQIRAAIKLARDFEKGLSKEDLKLAQEQGYTTNGLISGAWLGGVGGVRRVLRGQGNPSDKHWSSTGAGTTVRDRMKKFNYKLGGKIESPET